MPHKTAASVLATPCYFVKVPTKVKKLFLILVDAESNVGAIVL
jgi:hypothetical protein